MNNLKILKIKVSGYKLLEDGFTLNLLNRSRVYDEDKNDEIIEVLENLYIPTVTVFTGRNSSGKSTVLSLMRFIRELLNSGRIKYNPMDFRNNDISVELHFLLDDNIYKYVGLISKPPMNTLNETNYCMIYNEKISSKKYYKSKSKNIFDSNFLDEDKYKSNVADTSILYTLTKDKLFMFKADNSNIISTLSMILHIYNLLKIDEKIILLIANLFDENIEEIKYNNETKLFDVTLKGLGKKLYNEDDMEILLSDGTKKGLTLFALSIGVLEKGGTLVIDEIENSFHKNLVENIIMMFNDKRINKNKANLMFSTHYVEILDIFRRRDNIFIMKKNDYITVCNLYEDYDTRVELSKSNQFNNNTFNTLINYEKLMELKKELIK